MSGKYKSKGLDDLANLKNFMNGNFIEIIKPAIKSKSNESVMKMMDIIRDKPEYWFEFISIAIFHQNFAIMKHMIEAFDITPHQMPLLNPMSMAADILSTDSFKQKQPDSKEGYIEVECPWIIQAAIGGDIDIIKYLLDNGFCENINAIGHIGLSRKYKNSIVTNCIGAAAYYGRDRILQYILEHYERKVDMNFKVIEKKGKMKHITLVKECSDYTPFHLAIASEAEQEKTIEVMKHLDGYKAIVSDYDFKGNSLLHNAAQYSKLAVVKYIIEEMHLDQYSKETNKEGQTPMGIAQLNKGEAIIDYLRNNTEQLDEKIEEDLRELVETQSNKKKGKKKKKNNANNEPGLLNSTEYQETIKIETEKQQQAKTKEQEKEKEKEKEKESVIEQTVESNSSVSEKTGNVETVTSNSYIEKPKQNKKQNTNKPKAKDNHNYDYDYNYNYDQGYDYDYNNNYDYGHYRQSKQGGYNRKNYPQQRGGYNYNNDYEYGNKKYQGNQQKENSNTKQKYYLQEIPAEKTLEKPIIEPKVETIDEDGHVEPKTVNDIEIVKAPPQEIPQYNINKASLPNEEEDNEDEDEDEDFLEEDKEEPKQLYQPQPQSQPQLQAEQAASHPQRNIDEKIDYSQLIDKYNQLEKQYELIQIEKQQLESFIKSSTPSSSSLNQATRSTSTTLSSSEENINDLLELANDELDQKNKEITLLQQKVDIVDLTNIKAYSLEKLTKIKDFYESNLKFVNDAIYSLDK